MIDFTQNTRGLLTLRDGRKFYSTDIRVVSGVVFIKIDKNKTEDWMADGRYDLDRETPNDIVAFDPNYRFLDAVRNHIDDFIELWRPVS